MSNSYVAPFGIASRPFTPGGTFPGQPAFATPAGQGNVRDLGFPVTNGPPSMANNINGWASGVQRENRIIASTDATNGQIAYHVVCLPDKNSDTSVSRIKDVGHAMLGFALRCTCLALRVRVMGRVRLAPVVH